MVYVIWLNGGFVAVDISTPTAPIMVGTLLAQGAANGIAVHQGRVYLAHGWMGFRIVDVSDPANPHQLGIYDTPGWPSGVTIAGIFDRRTMIGGATEAEGNVVAAPNPGAMIMQGHACKYSLIAGNRIGTVSAGTQSPQGLTIGCEHTTIQNNTIANNLASGVAISGFSYNTIRRNSIHSNSGPGISLTKGANGMLAPPRITAISGGVVRGTACPNYEVEIFSDAEDEGRIFEGAVTAEASGTFSFRKASPLIGPNITATATDSQGNTSEFSVPRAVKPAFRKK